MKFIKLGWLLAVCGLIGCQSSAPSRAGAPGYNELAQATFVGVLDRPTRLHDGQFLGEPVSEGAAARDAVRLLDAAYLTGDLDGNADAEAAVLLSSNRGGSGSFVYLAIANRGNLGGIPTQLIGDRVQIRALAISSEQVTAEVIRAGAADAVCCPGEVVELSWRYAQGTISPVQAHNQRTLGLADLAGAWQLVDFSSHTITDPITLTIDGAALRGKAACNSYFGDLRLGDRPGQLRVGPLGSTLMACTEQTDALEHAYLDALGRVKTYGFAPGQLILSYAETEEAGGVLLFLTFTAMPLK